MGETDDNSLFNYQKDDIYNKPCGAERSYVNVLKECKTKVTFLQV